jgi:hypothetical protein
MIAFGSDRANSMIGDEESVFQKLKSRNINLVSFPCLCHSLNLCASKACKIIPVRVEKFVRDVYNFFSNSSKRKREFEKLQVEFGMYKVHKILSPGQTRWLSYGACLQRILDKWEVLSAYFKVHEEELYKNFCSADVIFTVKYVNYFMQKFNKANALFQSQSCTIHIVHEEMVSLYKQVLRFCIKISLFQLGDQYILLNEVVDLEENLLTYEETFTAISKRVLEESDWEFNSISEECKQQLQSFIIILCRKLRIYYPYSNQLMPSLQILDYRGKYAPEKLDILMKAFGYQFTRFERLAIYDEYDTIFTKNWKEDPEFNEYFNSVSVCIDREYSVENFWGKLHEFSIGNPATYKFVNISKFMCVLMSLPHSNADTERAFSSVKNIKTDKRNKMCLETLEALLMVRTLFDGDYEKFTLPDSAILYSDSLRV